MSTKCEGLNLWNLPTKPKLDMDKISWEHKYSRLKWNPKLESVRGWHDPDKQINMGAWPKTIELKEDDKEEQVKLVASLNVGPNWNNKWDWIQSTNGVERIINQASG